MNYGTARDPKWIDNVIVRRRARKRWRCWGDGARQPNHAPGCSGWIEPGEAPYVEYIGETPSFQTGSHHTMACAEVFLVKRPDSIREPGVIDWTRVDRPA